MAAVADFSYRESKATDGVVEGGGAGGGSGEGDVVVAGIIEVDGPGEGARRGGSGGGGGGSGAASAAGKPRNLKPLDSSSRSPQSTEAAYGAQYTKHAYMQDAHQLTTDDDPLGDAASVGVDGGGGGGDDDGSVNATMFPPDPDDDDDGNNDDADTAGAPTGVAHHGASSVVETAGQAGRGSRAKVQRKE